MYSLVRRPAAVMLVMAVALPFARIRAQDARELTRRVDAAVARRNKATADLLSYRRDLAGSQLYPDTIAIADGALLIVTSHELLPLVRAAAASADSMLRHRAGFGLLSLRGAVLGVRSDSIRGGSGALAVERQIKDEEPSVRWARADRASITLALEEHAQRLLLSRGAPRLREWLASVPIDSSLDEDWGAVRRQLVTSFASVAHRCYAGDLSACKVTLGLVVEPDPVLAWYDSTTRRALVNERRRFGHLDRLVAEGCVRGSDAECIALMRANAYLLPWSAPPGTGQARATLVQLAFAAGGPGALQRLIQNGGSPSDGLSAAAKVPIDTLIGQWLRNVRTRGITSDTFTPNIALIAIGWMLAIGALALLSTRWR